MAGKRGRSWTFRVRDLVAIAESLERTAMSIKAAAMGLPPETVLTMKDISTMPTYVASLAAFAGRLQGEVNCYPMRAARTVEVEKPPKPLKASKGPKEIKGKRRPVSDSVSDSPGK